MNDLRNLLADFKDTKNVHRPVIFNLSDKTDKTDFNDLIKSSKVAFVCDEINSQLQELIKGRNPSIKIKKEEYPGLIEKHLAGRDINDYGVWVYYPWTRRLVHLLNEDEFISSRST